MTGDDLTFEVLHWVYINRPLVCGTTAEREFRPDPADVEAEFAAGRILPRVGRWELSEAGELMWASLQGCMAGAR